MTKMQIKLELAKTHLVTVRKILALTKCSKEIFEASNMDKKTTIFKIFTSKY